MPNPSPALSPAIIFRAGAVAMAAVIALSNYLVLVPVNDWLTWGHFSYPLAFLVTDCANRAAGARTAARVVAAGFLFGVPLSFVVNAAFPHPDAADPLFTAARIAGASGAAFLAGQALDVAVFNRLRKAAWWKAPAASSAAGSVADTFLFYALAFAGGDAPWTTWALGDLGVKMAMLVVLLPPYRLFVLRMLTSARSPGHPAAQSAGR